MNSSKQERKLLRVLVVCKGSAKIGLGHVFRSRAVAHQLARLSSTKLLVIGDQYIEGLLAGRGLSYEIVSTESDAIIEIEKYDPNVVLFDMLDFEPTRFRTVNEQSMTVSISPIFNCLTSVDLLFHRTSVLDQDWDLGSFSGEARCDLKYTVVREQCRRIPTERYEQNLREEPLGVAVSLGGADAGNRTIEVLRAIRTIPDPMLFWVLLGEGYAHAYEPLVETAKRDTRHEIILAKTSDSMWRLLGGCAVAVLAGGTITYEAAFAGLPSINLFDKNEHLFLVRELSQRGVCISAGYPFEEALNVALATLSHLHRHRDELREMHKRSKELIDGQGAKRIADESIAHYWREIPGA